MISFVKAYILEIERIEKSYLKMLYQYRDEFYILKERYIKKQNLEDLETQDHFQVSL